jgi:bacteriorhodopsin
LQGWHWQKDLLVSKGPVSKDASGSISANPFYSRDYSDSPIYILFYVRYADMALTGPLLLTCISLLATPPLASIIFIVGCNVFMTGCLFLGAVMLTSAKWVMWFFALFFYANVVYMLLRGFKGSTTVGSSVGSTYSCLSFVLLICWTPMLLLWALSDGSHSLPNSLTIFINGGLDLVSKAFFGVILLRSQFVRQGVAYHVSTEVPPAFQVQSSNADEVEDNQDSA